MKPILQRPEARGGALSRRLFGLSACALGVLLHTACSTMVIKKPCSLQGGRPTPCISAERNPVIFIHGTMGSRLVEDGSGRVIWGDFSRDAANGKCVDAVRGMALPMQSGVPLDRLRDRTRAVGSLDSINLSLLGAMVVNVPIYGDTAERFSDIAAGAGESGAVTAGRRLDFYYDWRRSCDENARLFAAFVRERRAELVGKHGFPAGMRFNVVAHSQGSMILAYYLRYGDARLPGDGSLPALDWSGARDVEKVVLIGPPNAGVGPTLEYLTSGHRAQFLLPKYEAAVVGTMPSLYQMMPRARDGVLLEPGSRRVLDPLDFDLWVRNEWGLANPEQDKVLELLLPGVESREQRRMIALDHLRKCLAKARQVQAALDVVAQPPGHLQTVVCAGSSIETMVGFLATPRHLKVERMEKGDGTVAVYSALSRPYERRDAFFFDCDHLDLATDEDVDAHISACFGPVVPGRHPSVPGSHATGEPFLAVHP